MLALRRPSKARLAFLFAALALVAGPGCGKGRKNSKNPTATKEEVEAKIKDAKKKAKANSLIDLANEDLAKGLYKSAARRAEEALAADPNDANAHAVLGAALWRAGDFEGSTAAYRKAIEVDAKNFGAVLGLARNLQAAGQHKEAADLQDGLIAQDKEQVDPRLGKLWSYYALVEPEAAQKELDEIFKKLPANDPQLAVVQAHASFLRALAGKGPFHQVNGVMGSSDANLNLEVGVKYSGATVGGEFSQVVFLEIREESLIDTDLAKQLKLPELAKFKPLDGAGEEQAIVLVPEVKFKDLTLKNVPAIVRSLEPYAGIGEKPGLILGRQAMHALGSITFDFPKRALTITKDAPAQAPAGAADLPLLLVSFHVLQAPAVPVSLGGSDYKFFVYLGGTYRAGLSIARKQYLKSGNLPRTVENPEDAQNGLKMVYVDKYKLGEVQQPGVGTIVLLNPEPDATLALFVNNTAFELGGYVNLALMQNWKMTYALGKGRLYVETGG
jgi:tetratricopeptide (TPR) repeat protein